jgi:hypothetical protein
LSATRPKLKQPTPTELVNSVMTAIRSLYCPSMDDQTWMKTNYRLTRDWCIFWAARFIAEKGFTLPADRFKAILLNVVSEAKREKTGAIAYLPAFLGKCVQSHFKIHWEEYYQEAKSVQNQAEAALLTLGKLPTPTDRTVENLAAAAKVLASARRKQKKKPAAETQFSLL